MVSSNDRHHAARCTFVHLASTVSLWGSVTCLGIARQMGVSNLYPEGGRWRWRYLAHVTSSCSNQFVNSTEALWRPHSPLLRLLHKTARPTVLESTFVVACCGILHLPLLYWWVDLTLYQGYIMVRELPHAIGPITVAGPGIRAAVDLSSRAR